MNRKTQNPITDRKSVLFALWIFVTLNYIYCDVFSLMNSEELKQIMTGTVGSIQMTPQFLLYAALLMEIPLAMILISRWVKYRANRIINIIAGFIMTAVQIMSLFVGAAPVLHYVFFSIIEISCTIFIVFYAWSWPRPDESGIEKGSK